MTADSFVQAAPDGAGVNILVKAVPGAKRDEVVGRLGDRLKVRVSAPPEGGRANKAICAMLADVMGVRARDVEVIRGHSSAEKTVRISGLTIEAAHLRLSSRDRTP